MRRTDEANAALFSYVDLETRIPARHPPRKIRLVVNEALASPDFDRPSIPSERLMRASLIQILFSVRSGRQVIEPMRHTLLARWFGGLGIDDPV